MITRRNLARLLLFIATVYWGVWLGGYIFNALMLVPVWDHDPPGSMISYFGTPRFLAYFFTLVNPWVFIVTLVAWALTRKLDTEAGYWIGWATVLAWLMLPLKIWMILTIGGVVRATLEGNFEPSMIDTVSWWRNMNWLTISIATVIMTLHLLAILNFNTSRRARGQASGSTAEARWAA